MKLFIDTWGWLTLRDRREAPHQLVRRLYRDYRYHRGVIYTSDYVLDETVTLLFRRLHFAAAQEVAGVYPAGDQRRVSAFGMGNARTL